MSNTVRQPMANTVTERCVALIAHDAKKEAPLSVLRAFLPLLSRSHIVATHGTGAMAAQWLGFPVTMVRSGHQGGYLQVGALVVQGAVDALLFLRDPYALTCHESDSQALLRTCDVRNVPVATNAATARAVLSALQESLPRNREAAASRPVQASATGRARK